MVSATRRPKTVKRTDLHGKTRTFECSDDGKYYFDYDEADRVCEFFSFYLTHQKGEWRGRPLDLAEWEKQIIRDVFGWKRVEDDLRRYTTLYLEVPRKNGKSLIGAGIALWCLLCDNEPAAEVYSAAADRKQAKIVFNIACEMVKLCPDLQSQCQIYRGSSTITVETTGSKYEACSAEAYTKDGLNASCIIFDELHAQKKRELYDVLRTSMAARRQPLEVYITTAGSDVMSICFEVHDYALQVRNGTVKDDSFYCAIFSADKDDDWTDLNVWAKANPGLGESVKIAYIQKKCNEALAKPSYENTFKRLHLNIWTEAKTIWIPSQKWRFCQHEFDESDADGQSIHMAIDLSKRIDLTALVFVWWHVLSKILRIHCKAFMPAECAKEREEADRVPYKRWAEEGWLTLTDGNIIDLDHIGDAVDSRREKSEVKSLLLDPWGSQSIQTRLTKDGAPVVECRQGYALSPFMKDFETMVNGAQIQHDGNPLLSWSLACTFVETNYKGDMRPNKGKSSGRIDPIVAMLMAVGGALGEQEEESVYEERGII